MLGFPGSNINLKKSPLSIVGGYDQKNTSTFGLTVWSTVLGTFSGFSSDITNEKVTLQDDFVHNTNSKIFILILFDSEIV